MAEKIPVSVDASWPPQAGAKVEYELNGRWFPGCISMASPTTLYFRYAARCLKNEEPIEREDLSRLRPQRRLRRGNVLLHGWPAAVVELLGQRLPEPLAFAVAGYACGCVRELRIPYGYAEWGPIECPILTPDGRCLVVATVGPEEENFSIMFYSLETGRCVRTLKNDLTKFSETDRLHHASWITVFFPGGGPWQSCNVFIAPTYPGDVGSCSVVDLAIGEVRWIESSLGGEVFYGAYASSKVQAHAVTANQQNECKIHDLATGGVIRSGDLIDDATYFDEEIYMRVSPDGSHVLLMRMHERASVKS